jgi:hypothetical protein
MKLEINEVYFINEAVKATSIKASDAKTVASLMDKLEKEFARLQKLEESKS